MRYSLPAVLLFGVCVAAKATDYLPKTDNQIAALELRTGKLIWTHKPKALSDAQFEVYPQGLAVYPQYARDGRQPFFFLDTATGETIKPFPLEGKKALAVSAAFWPPPPVQLDTGWELVGFSAGNSKELRFQAIDAERDKKPAAPQVINPKLPKVKDPDDVWTISTGGYPHAVASWKNIVMYAFSYLSDEGVIYAYRAGDDEPLWKADLNTIVPDLAEPLTRMRLQVIGNTLYVEANEHIFAFAPGNGKLYWHRDVCADLGLRFNGDLFGGALNLAVFAEADDVLIISFERRVIAYDLKNREYLWHFEPDTFPHCPFPAAHGGKVFLTVGANHHLHALAK